MENAREFDLRKVATTSFLALSLLVAVPGVVEAQSISFGKELFDTNCAACHGPEGAGDGPVAVYIEPKPTDLRNLAGPNDLGFPFGRVWNSIASGSLSAHGTSMMPVWGDLFMEEALPKEIHPGVSARDLVEARMLALTFYIQTLQE